jgi:2-deoxy-D-gluconate 3-dehydrogenase
MQDKTISDLISLKGKTAIVTGGANGIGFGISCRLAESGAAVYLADKNKLEGEKACSELKLKGFKVIFVETDVSDEDDVKRLVNTVTNQLGHVDILVNNAGIFPKIDFFSTGVEDFNNILAVNLRGTFLCSREASRAMIALNREGCIINIASIDAVHPSSRGFSAYDASKGGVLSLTKSLALELGKNNIRVNAIAPGGIMTGGAIAGSAGREMKSELKSFLSRIAIGRMGKPDDVARVALFLASDLSSYMTGSIVFVDGGYLIT